MRYRNDSFYDPARREHRRVSFGFFSYNLPLNPDSSRAWRFGWDPVFYELVKGVGGHLRFDLGIYRNLDPASRRLFLFVSKLFYRRSTIRLDVKMLGVHLLGFSATLAPRNLKAKIGHSVKRLEHVGILLNSSFERTGRGQYTITLHRGPYFGNQSPQAARRHTFGDSPVADPLKAIGFDEMAIRRLIREYPEPLLHEWADVTLAAMEKHGKRFFKRSPAAFFTDNVQNAAAGRRTPPDWWHRIRKSEEIAICRSNRGDKPSTPTSTADILRAASTESNGPMSQLVRSFVERQN